MSFAMVEHLTESLFFPEIKGYLFVSNIGLLMVLVGEIIRKIAVVTAGRAFTHVIRIQYEDQHQLVTHGIYRYLHHNSTFIVLSTVVAFLCMCSNLNIFFVAT